MLRCICGFKIISTVSWPRCETGPADTGPDVWYLSLYVNSCAATCKCRLHPIYNTPDTICSHSPTEILFGPRLSHFSTPAPQTPLTNLPPSIPQNNTSRTSPPIDSSRRRALQSHTKATMVGRLQAAASRAGNMTTPALPSRVPKPARQSRGSPANTGIERTSSWKLVDHGSLSAVEQELDTVAGLLALPKELQLMIAEYVSLLNRSLSIETKLTTPQVTMNEDRKNLCLTSKKLQQLMTPFLYKDMVISTRKISETFETTLTSSHPGIPHIRTLRVFIRSSTVDRSRIFSKDRVSRLCRLISTMRRDALTRFEYDSARAR